MRMGEGLLMELSHEVHNVRRHFERLPEDQFEYRPDEKSMTLGVLSAHIVESMGWLPDMIGKDVFDFDPTVYTPPSAENIQELLEITDRNLVVAQGALSDVSDEALIETWKMTVGGQVVVEMPKAVAVRSFCISHLIHHRGQLTVYMRLLGVPLPATYGPTADEPAFS